MVTPLDQPLSAPDDWSDPPDNEYARRALKFFRALPHTKGRLASEGKLLGDTWLPWEEKIVRHVYGTVDANGDRVYHTVYVEMPKKTGKSHIGAGIGLFGMTGDREYGAEVYSAGYNQNQAKVTWQLAADMVEAAPWLERRLEVKDYLNKIICSALNATYKPLTKGDLGEHGFNPSTCVFDELHTQQGRAMWDTVKDSMGARSQPMLFAITNAGIDRTSLCYEQRKYAMQVNDGEIDDPHFLGVVYGAHPEEDDWTEEDTWRKAHPGLGVTVPVKWVAQRCQEAEAVPSAQNSFLRWYLSIWTQQTTRWIPPEAWERCREDYDESDLAGPCYGGLDLGAVKDLTALLWLFPDRDDPETVRTLLRAWCPENRLWDRSNPYRAQYQVWARQGWLETVPGEVMDYAPVRQQIVEDFDAFGGVDMAVDQAFNGHDLMIRLREDHALSVLGMRTTYSHMTSPCDEFERRVLQDPPKIRHRGNPVLTWAVSNVALKQPDPDRKRPVKDTEDAKIDPVVALLMALDRAMRHEQRASTYDDPDKELLVL